VLPAPVPRWSAHQVSQRGAATRSSRGCAANREMLSLVAKVRLSAPALRRTESDRSGDQTGVTPTSSHNSPSVNHGRRTWIIRWQLAQSNTKSDSLVVRGCAPSLNAAVW
jgi:hypothetical protein